MTVQESVGIEWLAELVVCAGFFLIYLVEESVTSAAAPGLPLLLLLVLLLLLLLFDLSILALS